MLDPDFALTIGSRLEDLELVDLLMKAVLDHLEVDESEAANTMLAVREAAVNAVRHGSGHKESSLIRVAVSINSDLLTIELADDGPGFDPATVRDPLAPENLLRPCGRGIFLMRSFMDDVAFEFPASGGTVVRLERRLDGTTLPRSGSP